MSNTIKKDDPRLTAFVLGELSPADAEQIQSAISDSPELAAAVAEIRVAVELLGTAYHAESPLTLLDQQKSELARVVSEESGDSVAVGAGLDNVVAATSAGSVQSGPNSIGPIVSKKSRPWLPIALAASLLGLLVGGAFYFDRLGIDSSVAKKMDQAGQLSDSALKQIKEEANKAGEGSGGSVGEVVVDSFSQPAAQTMRDDADPSDRLRQEQAQFSKRFVEIPPSFENPQKLELTKEDSPGMPSDALEGDSLEAFGEQAKSARALPGRRMSRPLDGAVSGGASFGGVVVQDGGGQEGSGQDGGGREGKGQDAGGMVADEQSRLALPGVELPEVELSAMAMDDEAFDDEVELHELLSGDKFSSGGGGQGAAEMDFSVTEGLAGEAIGTHDRRTDDLSFRPMGSAVAAPAAEQAIGGGGVAGDDFQIHERYPRSPEIAPVEKFAMKRKAKKAEAKDMKLLADLESASPKQKALEVQGRSIAAYAIPKDSSKAPQKVAALGLDLTTRMETKTRTVPATRMRTENKTRSVPVQRMRTEDRIRIVDGKEETYQIEVPYTENVAQNYTVQVPYTENVTQNHQVPVPVLLLQQDKADKIIGELVKDFDPNGKREFELEELIQRSAQTWDLRKEESEASDSAVVPGTGNRAKNAASADTEGRTADQAQRLAVVLSNELKTESGASGEKLGYDVSGVLETLNKSLAKRNAEVRRTRTWKRVKAVPNTTRLMVGDKDELDLTGMQVNVQVDGFRARVLIDCFYYNDRANQLEGNFKLRLPDDASLYYFAFGESAYDLQPKGELAESEFLDDGTQFVSLGAPEIREARKDAWAKVKEARMVPREKAAHAYRETVRRKVDPALVEWSGAGVFNARVFPLAPQKLHRIVIGYDVNLTQTDNGWTYQLDLPEEPGQCQVDLNVQSIDGVEYSVTPKSEPTEPLENVIKGKEHQRYRFLGKQENGIQISANKAPQILLHSSDEDEGDFWGIQIKPDLPVEEVAGSPVGIFMVDTSLSSNPDKFNVWLSMLRSTLTNNRDSLKHFNVLFFNVDGHFWKEGYVANTPENVDELMETCDTLALEGATDLYGAIEQITNADWAYKSAESDESPRKPDLFLLSDGAATWGETNLRLISRQIADNNLGSLFAYQTGLTGTSISSLRFLAGETGGAVFSVATEDEIKTASTAHRKRPWQLKSVAAQGATDTMTAGRVAWVYPGQSLTIVGRGTLEGPLELELLQASEEKTIAISLDQIEQVESELASRLYGQIAVGQLESLGAKVFDVAASYARHFRVTGDTCSLLMLESEADYERFDIKPEEDLFVIKSKVAKDLITDTLKKSADQLADPKAQTLAWLERLETMPGMSFKMPTALKLAMDEIEIVAISKPLECSLTLTDDLSEAYLTGLKSERLDYEKIATEAQRRGGTSVDEAIKVFSSLVERNPGDIVIARDVAFTAMELERPAQAYHLLRRVAVARPFQGSVYPALGQCLAQLGQADMAIVYYEVALGGTFSRQGENFKQIVSTEYTHLLRKIASGKLESSVPDFAAARLETLEKAAHFKSADVVITMMWNTDQTDVDLHVVEPSGEECSYENKRTRTNGQITSDITTGFGPEMYFNAEAPQGKYEIKVKYFGNGQNRTELRNKIHLMIYRGYGTEEETVDRRTVQLKTVGKKESVATIGVE